MRLEAETYSIDELIERVEQGKLALPEFQRDFKWQPKEIADLVRTIARRWPMGTFLLLEVGEEAPVKTRPIDDAPEVDKPTRLLLDGQQRTTAIFQAFRDHNAGETYYIDLRSIAERDAFDDDDLKYLKTSRFKKQFPTVKEMAEQRIAPITVLANPKEWQRWLNYLDIEARERMVDVKEEHLPGFTAYDIPAHRLNEGSDLAAIAKIFETINRTGKRLAVFDLMVARLYKDPAGDSIFNLKSEWQKARDNNPTLVDFGYDDDDGIEILKVIALREHLRQRELGKEFTGKRIKGVNEADVLDLPRDLVVDEWTPAVKAYVSALEFLRDRCGVVRPNLMPAPGVVLALADALYPLTGKRDDLEDDLVRWVWATAFAQSYAQGANTQTIRDAGQLRAWQADPGSLPEVLKLFSFDAEALLEGRRRNDLLLKGILCLTVVHNARDWVKGNTFVSLPSSERLEAHHVVPADFLNVHYDGEADPLANFTVLTKSTNSALRDKMPRDVLVNPAVKHSAVESHPGLPHDELAADHTDDPSGYVERFLRARASRLAKLINEVVAAPVSVGSQTAIAAD